MAEANWRERARYRVDSILARGSAGALLWLGATTVLVTLLGALAFWILNIRWGERSGFGESLWQSFVIAIGKGTIDDANWTQRISSTFFIFLALFLAGSLVGLLVSAINRRLDLIRRGRSRVLERGHTVVLGNSARLNPVLDELLIDPHDRGPVVVLTQRDKTAMEDDFLARHRRAERKVIFRSGTPARRADLDLVGPGSARSVIVLNAGSDIDAVTVRRSLAANSFSPDSVHVVSEMTNERVARSLCEATGGQIATVRIDAAVADMLTQAIRSPGLAAVFDELLSFEGSELYAIPAEAAGGRSWREVAGSIDGAVALGWIDRGATVVAPAAAEPVPVGADLVVLAAGPSVALNATTSQAIDAVASGDPAPQSILVLGWSPTGAMMLAELDAFLPAGSQMRVMADTSMLADGFPDIASYSSTVEFSHTKHDPDEIRAVLDAERPDVMVVLGYLAGLSEEEADALTLLTLHTLSVDRSTGHRPRIVAQMLNNELGTLAGSDGTDDYVVTDALVSRMLVHTARERALSGFFDELFDAAGPAIALVPVRPGSYEGGGLRAALIERDTALLGFVVDGRVELNPDLARTWSFSAGDRAVVLQPGLGKS